MSLVKATRYFLVVTTSLMNQLPLPVLARLIRHALEHISPETDFVVFDPSCREKHQEDEGRTWLLPAPDLPRKVYAKLDDHGSVENLREWTGQPVNTQYIVTLLWADEW